MKNILENIVYYFLGMIFVGIIIWLLLDFLIMPFVVRKGDEIIMPNVIGMNVDSASKILKEYSLNPIIDTLIPSSIYPKGFIIEQNPSPNYKVKKHRKVFLVVSGGIEFVSVPNVIGKRRDEAEDILKSYGFEVEVEYSLVKGMESDIVLDISPSVNSKIPKGSKVKIFVSKETL
ncbi:MAG: PASTA domain-containing protein [candidate division WOR-3 bacterium]